MTTLRPYDFRKPERLAGTLEQRLLGWLRAAGQLAGERSGHHLAFRAEAAPRGVDNLPPAEALARLPDALVGYRMGFAGEPADMLLAWPRPLALALVAGTLGETPAELPADRELTVVERSLCEYLMQNLIVDVLQETWAGAEPLALALGEPEPSPRWTRLFVKAGQVIRCTFTMRGPFGEQDWYWLAPHRPLHQRVSRLDEAALTLAAGSASAKLAALVRELPVELTVELGSVELPIAQLASLAPGDLLILNQRVGEPLTARVDNRPKFRGWPGRVGTRQSLQIESVAE